MTVSASRRVRLVASGATAVAIVIIAAATLPAAQTPVATMAIHGRVVAEATGQPIRRALVVTHSADTKTTRATTSDLDGWFTFDGLPVGQYRTGASKAPYVARAVDVGPSRRWSLCPWGPSSPVWRCIHRGNMRPAPRFK